MVCRRIRLRLEAGRSAALQGWRSRLRRVPIGCSLKQAHRRTPHGVLFVFTPPKRIPTPLPFALYKEKLVSYYIPVSNYTYKE
jgi:hypothetical protein